MTPCQERTLSGQQTSIHVMGSLKILKRKYIAIIQTSDPVVRSVLLNTEWGRSIYGHAKKMIEY